MNTVQEPLIGAHMSIEGGVHFAIQRGESIGCKTIQLFTKNNTRWNAPPLEEEESRRFRELASKTNILPIIAHSSYLINLSAQDKKVLIRSHYALMDEMLRCEMLGIKHIVIHPGYHGGAGIEQGLKKIALSIDMVYEKLPNIDVSITLETTAGQGTSIGFRFEHLREVIDNSNYKEKISVCIDTAHIFEAGYDIRSYDKYNETMNEFCEIIGLKNLKVIHINDSKTPLGSNVDRHEHIGKGKIGIDAFRFIMSDERLANIPKILETPKGEDLKEDIENIDILKNLVDKI